MSRSLVVLAFLFGGASTTSLMGCLITQEPSFDAPANSPPSVHGTATTPMYRPLLRRVGPLDSPFPGDSGELDVTETDVEITAIVRDADVLEPLEGRVYLNLVRDDEQPQQNLVSEIEIPHSNGSLERRVPFTVPRGRLRANCNVIELHVSRAFRRFPSLEPVEDGMQEGTRRDLGVGVWFVAGFDDGNPMPNFSGCDLTAQ